MTISTGLDLSGSDRVGLCYGIVLWYGLGKPVIALKIGNWSVFVLFGQVGSTCVVVLCYGTALERRQLPPK